VTSGKRCQRIMMETMENAGKYTGLHTTASSPQGIYTDYVKDVGDRVADGGSGDKCGDLINDDVPNPDIVLQLGTYEAPSDEARSGTIAGVQKVNTSESLPSLIRGMADAPLE